MLRDKNLKFPDAQSLADLSGWKVIEPTWMSMEVTVTIVSKLVYFTYLGDEINLLILGLSSSY